MEQRSVGRGAGDFGSEAETGGRAARLTGAFDRYRQAIPEQRVAEMLRGQAAFSREGPLSAWVVMWLMIFQRLDAKGTLSAAVRQVWAVRSGLR